MKFKICVLSLCLMGSVISYGNNSQTTVSFNNTELDDIQAGVYMTRVMGGPLAGLIAMRINTESKNRRQAIIDKEFDKETRRKLEKNFRIKMQDDMFKDYVNKIQNYTDRVNRIDREMDKLKVELEVIEDSNESSKPKDFSVEKAEMKSQLAEKKYQIKALGIERTKNMVLINDMTQEIYDEINKRWPIKQDPKLKVKTSLTRKAAVLALFLQTAELAYMGTEGKHEDDIYMLPFASITMDMINAIDKNQDCTEYEDGFEPTGLVDSIVSNTCLMVSSFSRNDEISKDFNDSEEEIEIKEMNVVEKDESGSSIN